jgi:hypothetical protein
MFGLDEFAPGDGSDAAMGMGGDATDGMMGDVADDEDDMDSLDGDEMGDDAGLSDRMDDLEDQLAQLTAEFDKIMPGEAEEEEHADEFGSEEGDEEGDEGGEEDTEEKESFAFEAKKADAEKKKADASKKKTAGEEMREYVEKIGGDRYNAYGKMGDNGANTKSLVAGKNDMGGTTANILASKNGEKGVEANKGQLKGNGVFKGTPKDMNTKNVNVPGSKTATKLSPVAKGHGAEKKGAGETADKSAGSMLNGAPKRAK